MKFVMSVGVIKNKTSIKETLWAYAFLFPSIVLFTAFVFIPVISAFSLTFFEWNMLNTPKFIGFENYNRLLNDVRAGTVIKNTLFFTVFAVIFKIVLGLFVALMVTKITRKYISAILESVFFFPILLPMSIVTMVWGMLLNTDMGVINGFLVTIGLKRIPWLIDLKWAMRSIIIIDVWKGLGFFFIIYLSALRNVPKEFYEAADIDGANGLQKFFRLTLPLVSPTTLLLTVTAIIGSLQVFDSAYILTRGGPGDATTTVVYYIWQNAFQMMNMGYGSTLAIILLVFILIVTGIQFALSKRWVFYD